jgi:hypothetical protein
MRPPQLHLQHTTWTEILQPPVRSHGKNARCRLQVRTPRLSGQSVLMRFGPFLVFAILLGLLWLVSFVLFHVAGALIHLLLVLAVIALIVHLFTGSRAV